MDSGSGGKLRSKVHIWDKVLERNIQMSASKSMHMLDLDREPNHIY